MTRGFYIGGLIVLALALAAVRLTLPPMGVPGPLFGRLQTIDIALATLIGAILFFALLRLLHAHLTPLWVVPLFLWFAACEPLLRGIIDGEMSGDDYVAVLANAPELPLMLAAFLLFLALFRRLGPHDSRAMPVAAVAAAVATIMRPFLIVSGLDRLPWVGDWINLSGDTLTALLRLENGVGAAKGLFIGQSWIGNALLVALFAGALAAAVMRSRE
jgi:hypothetical protein